MAVCGDGGDSSGFVCCVQRVSRLIRRVTKRDQAARFIEQYRDESIKSPADR